MTNVWYAIQVTGEPSAVEAIEFLFNQLDSLGTEVQQFHKADNEPVTVTGYFDEPPSEDDLNRKLQLSLRAYGLNREVIQKIKQKTIEQTDWLAEWKKHWRPTRVGRFLIAPQWEDLPDEGGGTIVIRVDPNMAFGTGTHETTQLCLKTIDKNLKPEMSFLDIGTGTGILAIAAAKMFDGNSGNILAIDNDKEAVIIARENARQNSVADRIEISWKELSGDDPQFDFVCANLTLDVILPALSLLLEKSRKTLVLSGILKEQEEKLMDALNRHKTSEIKIDTAGEWISALVRR